MRKHAIALVFLAVMVACLAGCASPGQTSGAATGLGPAASSGPVSDSATVSSASSQSGGSLADAGMAGQPNDTPADSVEPEAFASWNSEAGSLKALVSYVRAATDEGGPGYVPPQDRIAVFDMDGTFLSEKAPVYLDFMLLLYRVQTDGEFVPTDDMRALCDDMRASADRGIPLNDADRAYRKDDALVEAFAGMTFDEFYAYVARFMDTQDVEGFSGMTYGESFYKPMLEVISYLQANDFDVYVVTGCEREVARAAVGPYGIDPSHVIGSDWAYMATNQGDERGLDYTYGKDDDLMIASYYLGETGKTNKVIAIQREIGKRPALAFGNSSGDFAMLNYALDNEAYPSAAFLVVADDAEREYGDAEKAGAMRDEAANAGWSVISMRDDWRTIYGDGVVKTHLRADGA